MEITEKVIKTILYTYLGIFGYMVINFFYEQYKRFNPKNKYKIFHKEA